jgi:ribonuclease E
LSRQKKHSTIQEISYIKCPHCEGTGVRPSLEYTALNAYRRIELEVVKGAYLLCKVSLPQEVADYLLNNKRSELVKLETAYETRIHINGVANFVWDKLTIEKTPRPVLEAAGREMEPAGREEERPLANGFPEEEQEQANASITTESEETPAEAPPTLAPKKKRRRTRHKRKVTAGGPPDEATFVSGAEEEPLPEFPTLPEGDHPEEEQAVTPVAATEETIPPETAEPKKRPRRRVRSRRRKSPTAAAPQATPTAAPEETREQPVSGGSKEPVETEGEPGHLRLAKGTDGETRKKTYRRPRTRRKAPDNPSPAGAASTESQGPGGEES